MTCAKLNCLTKNVDHLIVCKKMNLGLFLKIVSKMFVINVYKPNLAFNNLQWLICHKTKLNLG